MNIAELFHSPTFTRFRNALPDRPSSAGGRRSTRSPQTNDLICIVILASSLAFSAALTAGEAGSASSVLRAGFARTDITPAKPVTLSGYASRKELSQGVHDPLSARAVAFQGDPGRLVLVSTDVIGFYGGTAEYLRKAILEACDLRASELFLSAIHTHSAPSLSLAGRGGHANNVAYTELLKERLVRLTRAALADPEVVQIGVGLGSSPVGVNRRQTVYDKLGNPQVRLGRNPAGANDPEVQVLKVTAKDGTLRAVLFGYATHSTSLGYDNFQISGDIHGLAEQFVERYLGSGVIAPAFAGASGDIDPWYRVLPGFNERNGWIPEPVLLSALLGEEVVHVSNRTSAKLGSGTVKGAFQTLRLPGKPSGELRATEDCPEATLNIAVARVGAVGFVGLGGEVGSEIGRAIKAAAPLRPTFIITHCNGAAGYLVSAPAYLEGGYEVESSPFASTAAERVVKEVLLMLNRL